ncbi:uncharacterized protein LOC141613672 [Silene latifolia]|uniref:uncharacterized protein LOC141613672 n=1 Tax=Silene latifolia TaxID=37657 RepID=UPI003D777280
MDPKDQEKTAFRSDRGLYCYNVMPFGLKNAGSTYQRLVNRMFKQKIPYEAKPPEMHFWSLLWEIPGVLGDAKRDRGQHGANKSSTSVRISSEAKGRIEAQRSGSSPKPVHIKAHKGVWGAQANEQPNASKATTTQWTYEAGILCTAIPQEEIDDWRKPYIIWLRDEVLPPDQKDTGTFKIKSSRFVLIDGILFRKSLAGPYLSCLSTHEAQALICDIHSGDCGNHTGGRSLSNKTLRQGYFWPTTRKDAIDYVKKCEECQRHAPVSHQSAEYMHPIISPWPFMKWEMDIVGPLPRASGNRAYVLAMTDYFSKWIEAEAFPQI